MTGAIRRSSTMACVAMVLASGCFRTSPSPEDVVMQKLLGDQVSLSYGGGLGLDGELLAVTDSSFILMGPRAWTQSGQWGARTTLRPASSSGVAVVPRQSIRRIEFGFTKFDTPNGVFSPGDRQRVAQRGRYPYGLSADAMAELLRATGQAKPDTIRLGRP